MSVLSKRVKVGIAALVPLAFALSACGGDTPPSDSQSNGNATSSTGGDEVLTVWAWDPAFNMNAMEVAEAIYQKDHPGFKLNLVETPWEDLQTKLTTLAMSNSLEELPDIFLVQNNAAQKNIINYPDVFASLDDTAIDFSQFPEAVVDYSTVDNKNYAVPFDSGTAINALRIDVLEQAGLSIEDFTDITYDEYIEKGKIVLEKTGKPLLSSVRGEADQIMMMLQSAGTSIFDNEGNPTIDTPDVKAALEKYVELVSSGVMIEKNSWDEYIGSMVNGEVAGAINGVWIVGSLQQAEDQAGLWEVTNLPKLAGVTNSTNYSANGGSSWAVSATGNHELAADFLAATFAGSTELYDTILPESGAVGNWIPAGGSAVYQEPQPFFHDQPIYELVVKFSESVPKNNTGAYYYEGRNAVGVAAAEVLGGADVSNALKEAQSNVEFAMQ